MGRIHTVNYLSPQQHATVDSCIRKHRFCNLDGILSELRESGIELARSSLHRYLRDMRSKDSLHTGTTDNTIVTIVERASGTTKTVSTGATAAAVVAMIEGSNPDI